MLQEGISLRDIQFDFKRSYFSGRWYHRKEHICIVYNFVYTLCMHQWVVTHKLHTY